MNFDEIMPEPLQKLLGIKASGVKQTIPMRPEWTEQVARMEELRKEINFMVKKYQSLQRAFWAKVEADTEIVDRMRYDEDKKVIEVMED